MTYKLALAAWLWSWRPGSIVSTPWPSCDLTLGVRVSTKRMVIGNPKGKEDHTDAI